MNYNPFLFSIAVICYSYSVKLCLKIQRTIKNKTFRYIIFSITTPIILLRWIWGIVYENTIGTIHVSIIKKKDNHRKFDVNLAVVAIAKNEASYIQEWIEYYRLNGVGHIYLYDNESNDHLKDTIQPYIDQKFITYHEFPGTAQQLPAYNHAIRHYKEKAKLMAFIDCDEFLMSTDFDCTLYETINSIYCKNIHAGGVAVNWCLYGSSGKETREPGLLIERFQMRATDQAWQNRLVKTIVNPRLVKDYISPHFPLYKLGAWSIDTKEKRVFAWFIRNVDFTKMRCNHFFCKTKEEFIKKQSRGLADRAGEHYDMNTFYRYDVNDIHDKSMLIYADGIRKSLSKLIMSQID